MRDPARFLCDFSRFFWTRAPEEDPVRSWLFEGTRFGVSIPLWESAVSGEGSVLKNRTTVSVLQAYAGQSLWPGDISQPGDFIGYEAEFLLILLRRGEKEAFDRFRKDHFAPLARKVLTAVRDCPVAGKYADWARKQLLALEELAFCSGEASVTGMHFRSISAQEADRLLQEHVVPTAGRGNCGGKCILYAHVKADCVTSLSTDETEGIHSLKACVRGRGYRSTFLSADRLRYPMVRTGKRGEGIFRRISWEETLDLLEERLRTLTGRYGPGCRYVNYASGVTSVARGDRIAKRLLSLSGGYLGNYNSYSAACAEVTLPYIYGTQYVKSSLSTYRDSKFLILWGANPVVTLHNARLYHLLQYHKEQGTPVVVIDPQFSDTAAVFATKWLPIRPGTDSALAAAMAWVLWEEGLADTAFMNRCCSGFDAAHMPAGYEDEENYWEYIYGIRDGVAKTPEWAAAITGIPDGEILWLARSYGKAKPAAILPGLGPQRHANGEQTIRSMAALACMTGNVGISGGGTAARGQLTQHTLPSLPMPDNPYGRSIPSFLWTDAVRRGSEMTAGEDHVRGGERLDADVKMIFNLAGNTLINQHSDANATACLLGDETKCEFIVVSDLFMTPSARFADLLLPGVSLFETEFISAPWAEGDYLLYGNRSITPLFEARDEFAWLSELALRLGLENLTEGCASLREWNQLIYDRLRESEPELPDFARFAADGVYRYRQETRTVAFAENVKDPVRFPFPTPSGKIEIFSPRLLAFGKPQEIPAIPKYVPAFEGAEDPVSERYPLQLLGWHTKRRCHSIHDNNPYMEGVEPHRLWIHPDDAGARGIAPEDLVEIYNDRGKVFARARVTVRVMPGVVALPQGAWFTPGEDGVDRRGCVNTLTTQRPTPLAKGNPQHSCLVEVRACMAGEDHQGGTANVET